MYKKLSKVFVATISIFSITMGGNKVFAQENLIDEFSDNGIKSKNLKLFGNKVVVNNESGLLKALDNENVTEIILEGNVKISNEINIKNQGKEKTLVIGTNEVKDSSLVLNKGVKVNGNGKLTIVKNNDKTKEVISFDGGENTLMNLNIIGNENEILLNNESFKLVLDNLNVKDGILFKNSKDKLQELRKVNFINSVISRGEQGSLRINKGSLISDNTSIYLSGNVATFNSSNTSNSFSVIAIDECGKVIESEKVTVDRNGRLKALIKGLCPGSNYKIHIVSFNKNNENSNYFLSSPCNFQTLDFQTEVEVKGANSAVIKIKKHNISEKYYPLYLILKENGEQFKEVELKKYNTKGSIIFNVTGLTENSKYSYEFVSYVKENEPLLIEKGEFTTLSSESNNSNVENLNFLISGEDINLNGYIEDTFIKINLNENIKNNIKNIEGVKTTIKGVTAKIEKNKLVIQNLIPGKDYHGFKVVLNRKDGKEVVINIGNFKTLEETTNINEFVKNVYYNAFNRNPDEYGFKYWTLMLQEGKIEPEIFIKNLLNEWEFMKIRPTTESKIEGLYKVIVNRESDKEGLKYWTNYYDLCISKGYSDKFSLSCVVNKMIEGEEFQNFIRNLRK